MSAEQQDVLLRFGAIVKDELEKSGQSLVLITRSGLDLSRFGVRYSHAGLSLKASRNAPWSVRQLYYACDERKPRLYDQGMSGFLLGADDPSTGYVSVVFLPREQAAPLEQAALDDTLVLQLLGAQYSANAYPFSARYQNCNQWVVELLAAAWGQPEPGQDLRAQAQAWLRDQGYAPSVFNVSHTLMWLGDFVPWVHSDDHPPEDLGQLSYRVSMPASIEAFVRATVPGATRMEFCHIGRRVVIRHGWDAIAEGCQPGERDRVLTLD
ncbi:MAG TPA: DUF2145 domain-containing protein [Methylibium sp.]